MCYISDLPQQGARGYIRNTDERSGDNTSTYRWTGSVYVNVTDKLSASEVKALYESNADTNAYTDEEKTKLTGIELGANNYVHPTTAGNKHIPTGGGAANQILKYSESGTAVWGDESEVQLQKSATHIQWKYDTDSTWNNLVALADLKGADGADGADGDTPGQRYRLLDRNRQRRNHPSRS